VHFAAPGATDKVEPAEMGSQPHIVLVASCAGAEVTHTGTHTLLYDSRKTYRHICNKQGHAVLHVCLWDMDAVPHHPLVRVQDVDVHVHLCRSGECVARG